jgi:hypothetical protein
MLIKIRFRFPELFLGMLLAVALFVLGVAFGSSRHQPSHEISETKDDKSKNPDSYWSALRDWMLHDSTGFFTFTLVGVGVAQIAVFLRQLRLIRESLTPAKDAAIAAKDSAVAQKDEFLATHRPKIRIKHLQLISDIWAGKSHLCEYWDIRGPSRTGGD